MSLALNPHRRRFLKVGLLGSATLAVVTCSTIFTRNAEKCQGCLWLNSDEQNILHAIIPVMLAGALPSETDKRKMAISEVVIGFDLSVSHFPASVRDEIKKIFLLLQFPLTRTLVAGVWSSWRNTKENDIKELLISWQNSDFDLLRIAYTALHDLINGSWYANPQSWQRINYPGPPKLI